MLQAYNHGQLHRITVQLCHQWLSFGGDMSFALYMIGLIVLLGGIAWALIAAGIAVTYIAISCLIVLGLGIMMAVSRTRSKDSST
jgi:membrane-bound acyltransferase YfiQ involved in biofilm formation